MLPVSTSLSVFQPLFPCVSALMLPVSKSLSVFQPLFPCVSALMLPVSKSLSVFQPLFPCVSALMLPVSTSQCVSAPVSVCFSPDAASRQDDCDAPRGQRTSAGAKQPRCVIHALGTLNLRLTSGGPLLWWLTFSLFIYKKEHYGL